MQAIKKINNNVALCLDGQNCELIAFGKGIGFPKMPYTITDLSVIDRTYYGVESRYLQLFDEISEVIFELTAEIIEMAQLELDQDIPSKVLFGLADHISFAVERYEKNILVKIPLYYDLQQFYQAEVRVGKRAVTLINQRLKVHLGKEDALGIALHFIDTVEVRPEEDCIDEDAVIQEMTNIIETTFAIQLNKEAINYARFVSHIQYLLKRRQENQPLISDNQKMFRMLKEEYPTVFICVKSMGKFLQKELNWQISEEEQLYLMLHVNRLCSREEREISG